MRITGGDSVTEAYAYDAAGTRVIRTRGGVATASLGGLVEEDVSPSATRTLYQFDGQVIAQRDAANGVLYVHSDHLGSVTKLTTSSGAVVSWQNDTPWGDLRPDGGGISQTTLNYTGQRRDDTGLLFCEEPPPHLRGARTLTVDAVSAITVRMAFEIVGPITNIETIAIGNAIREVARLRKQYGVGRWRKRKGVALVRLATGSIREAEIHWYEAAGIGRKELKIKRFLS